MKPLPTSLETVLRLDAETGALYWRRTGKMTGTPKGRGYLSFRLAGRNLHVHRVVYALAYGVDPFPLQVDHIDGDKSNNRPDNLRLLDNTENVRHRTRLNKNNRSGLNGIYFHKAAGRWAACIRVDNKNVHLGLFDTIEDAKAARLKAEIELWGTLA